MSIYTDTGKHKMFKKILEWFKGPSVQTNLDAYIASKNPTNTAEVEYWVNQYLHNKSWSVL